MGKIKANFIKWKEKVYDIYGDQYNLENTIYSGATKKVQVECVEHGIFSVFANNLVNNNLEKRTGCPVCTNKNRPITIDYINNLIKDQNFFIKEDIVFGNRKDYIKGIFCKNHVNKEIPCTPYLLEKRKAICSICEKEKRRNIIRERDIKKLTDDFISSAKHIHGERYSYDKTIYNYSLEHVIVTCKIHGDFNVSPNKHLSLKRGCPVCAGRGTKKDEVISVINENNRIYLGDNFKYPGNKLKKLNNVFCKKCSSELKNITYSQIERDTFGCSKCSNNGKSKGENELFDFIKEYFPNTMQSVKGKFSDRREIDIFIPELNIGFEFNGEYWHRENKDSYFKYKQVHDGIRIYFVQATEWETKKDIIKNIILNLLNIPGKKIYARKCEIKIVSTEDSRKFIDANHLQGYVGAKIKIGLYYNDELVQIMTFGRRKIMGNETEELIRFCTKKGYNIIGGASKILSHYIKNYNNSDLISYCDLRLSDGKIYEKLNFELINISAPGYCYVNRKGEKLSRYSCQKHKLNEVGTETEIMAKRGYSKYFDIGMKKYILYHRN